MPAKGTVQDGYLKEMADKKVTVRISFISGKELRGKVKAFDAFTMIVTAGDVDILVYKSAVAAIGPATKAE
jgi:host factor-I protein